jgi:hypothetical protein
MMGESPEEYDDYLRAKSSARSSAAAYVPLLTGTRDVVYTPTPDAPFASQLQAQPAVLRVPRPEGEVGMSSGSQAKRAVGGEGDGASPKAKARSGAETSSGSQQAGTGEEVSPKAAGVKKTISKSHQALRNSLEEELKCLTADSIRSRLKNEYSVDKSSKDGSDKPVAINKTNFTKPQLVELYVEASSKGNNLMRDKTNWNKNARGARLKV